jgi:DNA-binding NarL/FixJ family response regulator
MSSLSDTNQIRVLVAAPTPALRAGLRTLLATVELQVIGEAATLAGIANHLADVDVIVVADADLLADARGLADDRRLSIVALSDDDRAVAALRALPLAGWGAVSPEASAEDLRATILAAAQGMVVLPLQLAERLLDQRATIEALVGSPAESLTGREREVLELVSQGLSNKLIARRLRISEHTVKFHLSSIFTKLGASSRTDAVSRGARQGLVTL